MVAAHLQAGYRPMSGARSANLVYRYRHKPIAFFNDLHAELGDRAIAEAIQRHGLDIAAIEAAAERAQSLDLRNLFAAAHARAKHGGDFSMERSEPHVR